MILASLILLLFFGGVLAWFTQYINPKWPRWIALLSLVISLVILAMMGSQFSIDTQMARTDETWDLILILPWIPRFGIEFILAADALSYLMLVLTAVLGLIAVASAWDEIKQRTGFFYFNLLWVLAGVIGIFTAMDMFLFFFFWEVMLIPMYFIIAIWGHENRSYAAIKFFIFTQVSGLLMLLAIIVTAILLAQHSGKISFNYFEWVQAAKQGVIDPKISAYLMLGFFIAFAVKLPSFPFHTWLPDAHTQAPTAGSVILAGILLKTGAYGLLRFVLPLFPEAAQDFAPVAMTLGVISILYGASLAFAQQDVKRLIAYSSISHMGFVTLAIFAGTTVALQGAVMTLLAHGLSSAALFAMAGAIQHRLHTRQFADMGGLWQSAPRFGACMLFFCLAALGLPGLANFVGEFLVLIGGFSANPVLISIAALGMIAAPVYALMVMQKIFHGPQKEGLSLPDLNLRESSMMALLILLTLYLGFFPQEVLNMMEPLLSSYDQLAASATGVSQ
jgi:NADH-quinone oxidoreductase subunit M